MEFQTGLSVLGSGTSPDRTVRYATTLTDKTELNVITYHLGTGSGTYPNGSITDTLGRTIPIPLARKAPASPTTDEAPQSYVVPGFGEDTLTYKLHWKKLQDTTAEESGLTNYSDQLCYRSPGDHYSGAPQVPTGGCTLFNNGDIVPSSYVVTDIANGVFNPIVLTKVELPDGRFYKFSYDKYGQMDKIIYPTGGIETVTYGTVPSLAPPDASSPYDITAQANLGVTTRSVYESSGATAINWTYSATGGYTTPISSLTGLRVRTINPDSTKHDRFVFRTFGNCSGCNDPANNTYALGTFGYDTGLAGMTYEESDYTSATTDTLISTTKTTWELTGFTISNGTAAHDADWHPRVSKVEGIVYDVGTSSALSSAVTTDYDGSSARSSALNPTITKQYGFSTTIGSLGSLEKSVETQYVVGTTYDAKNLRSLPSLVLTLDASNNIKSKSIMNYDESGYGVSGKIGFPTRTLNYYDIASNLYVDSWITYDVYGNVTAIKDGRGNVSTVTFDSTYHTYPVSTTSPVPDSTGTHGSSTAFTTSTTYDTSTGLPTSTTDVNGQTTTMSYADPTTSIIDPLLRLRKVTEPNGRQTITEYGAGTSASTNWVKAKSQIDDTKWKEGYSWFDGLGRTIRSQSVDTAGDVFVITCYDNMGRAAKATNPFRGFTTQDCSTTTGLDWTTNTFDTAGRPWKVTTPDGAVVQTDYSLATSGSEIGTAVTVTDQAGKLRRSITNGLGQLIRVDEPDDSSSTGDLGAISSPNQKTTYAYDTLNNLTTVNQGAQTRTFAYDATSRLTSAANPESGTIGYTYDANGGLATKTDARGVKTTYTYDALNRVTNRAYSLTGSTPSNYQATPDVDYYYDSVTNAKGKLTKVSSSTSTTEYTSFDILGRVTASKQTTDGVEYGGSGSPAAMTYTYNLSGALMEETYPSGRVVKNELDVSGDLSQVSSKENSSAIFKTYANDFTYSAAGAVTSLKLGNGRFESTQFNSRLQPTQIALGASVGDTGLLKLAYGYGTTANNGNVLTQDITVKRPGTSDLVFNQTYTYDELNRLRVAEEKTGSTTNWKQTFTFDRYGNRRFDEANTTMPTSFANQALTNPTISTSNNRLTSTGWTYDAAGNTIGDPDGRSFTYDGENKQAEVKNSSNVSLGQYSYDGDGKRVKKVAGDEVTIFVYDASGKSIAEYSTIVASVEDAKVAYLTADHLGSPRINTDRDGNVTARHDYHPFGEEILTTQRTTALNYAADTVRKQFTGYERDRETELDFAQARYFASGFGRFSSPDDFLNDTDPPDPQGWNLYVYVRNNPLRLVDPDGQIKKDKNGKVIFDKTDEVQSEFYNQPVLDSSGKQIGTIKITWKADRGHIYADDGTKIEAFKNGKMEVTVTDASGNVLSAESQALEKDLQAKGFNNTTDCHGNTFANGEVWINDNQVEKLMKGDGYDIKNPTSNPQPGDVGIYSTDGSLKNTRHSVLVNVTGTDAAGSTDVFSVISKGGITPKVVTTPGPGRGTAWNDPNAKLQYYSKRTNAAGKKP
ncbi:MAG: RHS repeat protein [Chloracidobacterium sp.]|nr:RHS repeat protein [Chloracidobacterium sp.]